MVFKQNNTVIWNPIEGCKQDCPHCIAKLMARRTGGHKSLEYWMRQDIPCETGELHILDVPMKDAITNKAESFPFKFDPTFHRYRLDELANYSMPKNILVCTAGDFLGRWVPDDWIHLVMRTANIFTNNNYLFITKNPYRYNMFKERPQNMFFGVSITSKADMKLLYDCSPMINYVDINSMSSDIGLCDFIIHRPRQLDWVVVGLPNSSFDRMPQISFVQEVVSLCAVNNIPMFFYIKQNSKKSRGKHVTDVHLLGLPRKYPKMISRVIQST